ncbi:MAG: serine hydrolase domain-containing protein [Pirellulaceae bacterium]
MRIPAVWLLVGTIPFLGSVSSALAQNAPASTHNTADSTLSTEFANVPAIDERMDAFVRNREIAGAVTLVADAEAIVHLGAVGYAKLSDTSSDGQERMCVDSIFWIASMSKPVTGVCVLQLVDQGTLSLDDPIDRHLPEMRELKNDVGEKVTVTVEQLLNHTSGMRELKEPYASQSLADASLLYAKAGVEFPPGTKWQYSQTGINTAARIVEVISGLTFDEYARKFLFDPLGMKDTGFYLTAEQASRLATSYRRTPDGVLEPASIFLLGGKSPTAHDRMPAANGGLFSTAIDYARFCQMLLGNGSFQGKRILSEESVLTLRTPNTQDLVTGFTSGNAWGVGVCVVREPQGATGMLSPGTYGHGGAYGTQAWIDPVQGRTYILMVQRANFPNADDSDVRRGFQEIASRLPK